MVSIYQEAINKAAAQAAAETRIEKTVELALTLSKGYNRSFESILDDFKLPSEERKACMERYNKICG